MFFFYNYLNILNKKEGSTGDLTLAADEAKYFIDLRIVGKDDQASR